MAHGPSEGLKVARFLMVLSSISPLFLLWAIRGNKLVPDSYLLPFCAAMLVFPNLFLWLRIRTAMQLQERRELAIGSAEDHCDHILVYLFAMLLPLYPIDLGTWRDFAALISALTFIVFLFWHLNLHYMVRTWLRGETAFPKNVCLSVMVSPPRRAQITLNAPMEGERTACRNFIMHFLGILFTMSVGNQIEPELRPTCFSDNPNRPIIVSEGITGLLEQKLAKHYHGQRKTQAYLSAKKRRDQKLTGLS